MSFSASEDRSIASEAVRILQATEGRRMLASALGKRVADQLKQPLRDLLASRRFTDVLKTELADDISLSGEPQRLVITLLTQLPKDNSQADLLFEQSPQGINESSPSDRKFRKYEREFWRAFIEPQDRKRHRAVSPTAPFNWDDFRLPAELPAGWLSISQEFIASPDQSWAQKKAVTGANIELWCKQNNLDPEDFVERGARSAIKSQSMTGVERLRALIEAIPISQRGSLSLNIDLIYALITGK